MENILALETDLAVNKTLSFDIHKKFCVSCSLNNVNKKKTESIGRSTPPPLSYLKQNLIVHIAMIVVEPFIL